MSHEALREFVDAKAADLGVIGGAIGVWLDGAEAYACTGVTSADNPVPVTEDTLFALGSITKTYTATALMRLSAERRIQLDAPVRRYVPEFDLADRKAAKKITVRNLLNHSAGLDWRTGIDAGEGDDALAKEVSALRTLKLVAQPGIRASYSQVGYNLIGRIVECVTGQRFEAAISSLVLQPLDLSRSFFARDDIMTRRFAVGHNVDADGIHTARPWKYSRGDNPGAGLASSVAEQIRWARFHLSDGCSQDGVRVLPSETLLQMRTPTIASTGGALGDSIGLCWFLRKVDGVELVQHGGSANGQFANLVIAPARGFAIATLSNSGPDNGLAFNSAVLHWALSNYLHLSSDDPPAVPFDVGKAAEIAGQYVNGMMIIIIRHDAEKLTIECRIRPEIRAAAATDPPPDMPAAEFGLLAGDGGAFIITEGGLKGQQGGFSRDESGAITGLDLAGRLFQRALKSSQ